jgi:hypothetical protein
MEEQVGLPRDVLISSIGEALRRYWDHALEEPVPDRITRLLADLEDEDGARREE